MKKFFLNFTLVLAMVAGVGLAFVSQAKPVTQTLKAKINGVWVPISSSQEYTCEAHPNEECTAQFDASGNMIPETLVDGRFVAE